MFDGVSSSIRSLGGISGVRALVAAPRRRIGLAGSGIRAIKQCQC